MEPRVGVLALQGSADPHADRIRNLGLSPVLVRRPPHLDGLTHLILPGGESTTLHRLLTMYGLWEPIVARAKASELALFGTCAGAILLGRESAERPPRMGVLDAVVERNAYGTQVDSFSCDLSIEEGRPFHAVFIRAPRFGALGPHIRVLARLDGEPVLIESQGLLASAFHPELTNDLRIHERFVAMQPVACEGAA